MASIVRDGIYPLVRCKGSKILVFAVQNDGYL